MKKAFLFLVLATIVTGLLAQTQVKPTTKPAAGSSLLGGIYYGPSGSTVILQNNAKNDLTITAKKEAGLVFSSNSFSFASPFPNGSKYKVTIKKAPAGQTCIIYSGSEGTMPQSTNSLRVCSDYTYDHVSRSSDDKTFSTFYESSDPDVGGAEGEDGRYVVFVSSSSGFAGSSGKHRQIFWRDRNTGITKLVSASAIGGEGNGDSYYPAISGDGKTVAFESNSSNLTENDKNGFRDVFVWNSVTGEIKTVSVGKNGAPADAESYEASVSGDGNLIAFTSTSSNISGVEKGVSNNNVFLCDMLHDTTIMISIDHKSKKGGGGSKPSVSYDGNRIAFYSHTATLVPDDNNELWDIFLWEKNNKLKRISLTSDHKERNQGNESANRVVAPSISGNGHYIAYSTTATNMVTDDNNNFQDVFLYDSKTDSTVMVSNANDGKQGNSDSPIGQGEKIAITYDGSWVAFSTNASNLGVPAANIVMHNNTTRQNKAVSTVVGSSVGRATLSQHGGYVVFGIGGKLDSRFQSSGIFANYTGIGPCRFSQE